jgi:hypothetical protein
MTNEELIKNRSKLGIYVKTGWRIEIKEMFHGTAFYYAVSKQAGRAERQFPVRNVLEYANLLKRAGYEFKFPKFDLSGIYLNEPLFEALVTEKNPLVIFMESGKSEITTIREFSFENFDKLMQSNGRR